MPSNNVKDEAERLVREHGAEAYQTAREAMRLARNRRNGRLERYLSSVAQEVARRQKLIVGVDTATKYLDQGRNPEAG